MIELSSLINLDGRGVFGLRVKPHHPSVRDHAISIAHPFCHLEIAFVPLVLPIFGLRVDFTHFGFDNPTLRCLRVR